MQIVHASIHSIKRYAHHIGHSALEFVWPTRCACCEKLGALLCHSCEEGLPYIDGKLACPRCGAPLGRLVCTECTPVYEPQSFGFTQACCALEFTEDSRRLITAYKDGNERRLAPLLARLLSRTIPLEWRLRADALTWIPADAKALRRRGFDHMELIARSLAEQTGLRALPTIEKLSRTDQRRLNRAERRHNTEALFSIRKSIREPGRDGDGKEMPVLLRNTCLILIDDVFTTGATLDAATKTLRGAGVGEVRVATIARVW